MQNTIAHLGEMDTHPRTGLPPGHSAAPTDTHCSCNIAVASWTVIDCGGVGLTFASRPGLSWRPLMTLDQRDGCRTAEHFAGVTSHLVLEGAVRASSYAAVQRQHILGLYRNSAEIRLGLVLRNSRRSFGGLGRFDEQYTRSASAFISTSIPEDFAVFLQNSWALAGCFSRSSSVYQRAILPLLYSIRKHGCGCRNPQTLINALRHTSLGL